MAGKISEAEGIISLEVMADRDICVLHVSGSLELEMREAFNSAAEKLLLAEQPRLVIDLVLAEKVFTVFIGTIADLSLRADRLGKPLTVLASIPVGKLFDQCGLKDRVNLVLCKKD